MTGLLDDVAEALVRSADPYRTAAPGQPAPSYEPPKLGTIPKQPISSHVEANEKATARSKAIGEAVASCLGRGFRCVHVGEIHGFHSDYSIDLERTTEHGHCVIRLKFSDREMKAATLDPSLFIQRLVDRAYEVYGIDAAGQVRSYELGGKCSNGSNA